MKSNKKAFALPVALLLLVVMTLMGATLVSISVFTAVVIALLITTRRALKSDLAMVLKGE